MEDLGRIYTVKPAADPQGPGMGRKSSVKLPREWVHVNSAGFAKTLMLDRAAKLIGCDPGELRHQISRRGMTHVVVRQSYHWYC